MYGKPSPAALTVKFKPMTPQEVGELEAKVAFWSHQISGDVTPAVNGWTVRVEYRDAVLEFNFDHSAGDETNKQGRKPEAVDVISALWAHTAMVRHGEAAFQKSFGSKAAAKAMWAEWQRQAEWCSAVFGKEFGRKS